MNEKDFIMSPKVDFAFKLLFGDEKNKDLLIDLLSTILKQPKEDFEDIILINTELLRTYEDDKKGILDVRAAMKNGEQIDIEIQVLPTRFMPQRTLFYWSKMFSSQLKAGETYDVLKKCITINIVDFRCVDINKIHTTYHIAEDETRDILSDVLEIHFLEIPKVEDREALSDANDPIIEWLEFLNAKTREVMQVLAEKNESIGRAYDVLSRISMDDKKRMIYEAREAEIRDQLIREKTAIQEGKALGEEIGKEIGREEKGYDVARKMLALGMDIETIASITDLTVEAVAALKNE